MKNRLNNLYPAPLVEGIFYEMSQNEELVAIFQSIGLTSEDDFHSIDIDYILNNSGEKPLSIVAEFYYRQYLMTRDGQYVVDLSGNKMTYLDAQHFMSQSLINNIIKLRFAKKWTDLIETVYASYNILTPYEMDVSESNNEVESETGSSSTSASSKSSTETESTNTNVKQVAGYNDSNFVDSEKDTVTDGGDSSSETSSSGSRSSERDRTNMATRTITRKGNIGNRSAAELLEQQRELVKFQVLQEIYNDLDSVLVRSMY